MATSHADKRKMMKQNYTNILESRLRRSIETKLEDEQAKFGAGRQIIDNIYILKYNIKRKIETGEILYIAFIDPRSVFDSVERYVI